jgi:hypothetical protein
VPITRPSRVIVVVTVGICESPAVELGRGKCLGQAEIEDFDLTLRRDLDVGGFEIAMDDTLRVRRIERVGNLSGQPQRLAHGTGPRAMTSASVSPSTSSSTRARTPSHSSIPCKCAMCG